WILCRAQEASDQFVETCPFGTSYLDHAIYRRAECDLGECASDVIGGHWLRQSRWQVNRLSDGAELGDAAHEFEELRCPNDRIRNPGSLDQVFLGHFRAKIATCKKALSADD